MRDLKEFIVEAKSLWFAYFLNNENYEVDCYVFGDGGVCALM